MLDQFIYKLLCTLRLHKLIDKLYPIVEGEVDQCEECGRYFLQEQIAIGCLARWCPSCEENIDEEQYQLT